MENSSMWIESDGLSQNILGSLHHSGEKNGLSLNFYVLSRHDTND